MAGYWKKDAGRIVYTIHTASLREALGSNERFDAVLRFLRDHEALILGRKSSKALKPSLTQQCESTPKWPGRGSVRSVVFFRRI
ncbi:MAG: hypothetical protein C0458_26690 [Methylobacterium sp.]|nr:hypothetical protein [Methylobacterium sp.]